MSNWFSRVKTAGIRDFIDRYRNILSIISGLLLGTSLIALEEKMLSDRTFAEKVINYVESNEDELQEYVDLANKRITSGVDADYEHRPIPHSEKSIINDNIVDFIKKHEGFRSKRYFCTKDKPTIGYGFNLESNFFKNRLGKDYGKYLNGQKLMSREVADSLLGEYISTVAVPDAISAFPNFKEHPKDVQKILINMAYQLGGASLRNFDDMRAALLNFDYEKAADEMLNSKWHNQDTPRRARELSNYMRQFVTD